MEARMGAALEVGIGDSGGELFFCAGSTHRHLQSLVLVGDDEFDVGGNLLGQRRFGRLSAQRKGDGDERRASGTRDGSER